MNKVPITREGLEKLRKELEHMRTVLMPANIRDIETARAHGDLSENAEYTAAKEMQSFIHTRIQELERNISFSEVIEILDIPTDTVVFGTMVLIDDTKTGEQIEYQLVGPYESDVDARKISISSPIGRSLLGHCVGDSVVVKTPGGIRELEIRAIGSVKSDN